MSAGVTRTLLLDQSYCQTLITANDEEIRLFEQQFEKSLHHSSSCHHVLSPSTSVNNIVYLQKLITNNKIQTREEGTGQQPLLCTQ